MGYDGGRGAQRAIDRLDYFQHPFACRIVQGACGLIAQEHFGSFRNGPGDGHALLLSAGHLGREVMHAGFQAHELQGVFGRHRMFGDLGDQFHVLQRGKTRDQVVELEYEPHGFPSETGPFAFIRPGYFPFAVVDLSARWHIETAQDVEQGRLTATRCPQEDGQFTRVQVQIDPPQGGHVHLAHAVDLGDVAGAEYRICLICGVVVGAVYRICLICGHAVSSWS